MPLDHAAGGAPVLTSPSGGFWQESAYLVVVDSGGSAVARRIPTAETFAVFVDDDGVLRTDHELRLWNKRVLQLHYRMARER